MRKKKDTTFRIKPCKGNHFKSTVSPPSLSFAPAPPTQHVCVCVQVVLTLELLRPLSPPPRHQQTVSTSDIQFMNDMFQEIDLDNSGYIGRNEFSKNLKLHMAPEAQKFINDYLEFVAHRHTALPQRTSELTPSLERQQNKASLICGAIPLPAV